MSIEYHFLLFIGLTYESEGDFENAKDYYLQALLMDQENEEAFKHLGHLAYLEGKILEAASFYYKAINLNQSDDAVYHTLGDISSELGDFQAAEHWYELAL